MNVGSLNRWVRIEVDRGDAKSATGAVVEDWELFSEGFASIKAMKPGDEKYASGQPFSEQYFTIAMRWNPTLEKVTTKMRLIDCHNRNAIRTFDIRGHDNQRDRNYYIIFNCRLLQL